MADRLRAKLDRRKVTDKAPAVAILLHRQPPGEHNGRQQQDRKRMHEIAPYDDTPGGTPERSIKGLGE